MCKCAVAKANVIFAPASFSSLSLSVSLGFNDEDEPFHSSIHYFNITLKREMDQSDQESEGYITPKKPKEDEEVKTTAVTNAEKPEVDENDFLMDEDSSSVISNGEIDEDTLLRDDDDMDDDDDLKNHSGVESDPCDDLKNHSGVESVPCDDPKNYSGAGSDDFAFLKDYSGAESDYQFGNLSNVSRYSPVSPPEFSKIDFGSWNDGGGDNSKYQLWNHDEGFRANAIKFVEAASKYGNKCIEVTQRAHQRKPTVVEFWNYFMSKTVPRQSWYGAWKTVNHERRGWPLQFSEKAKVLVNSVSFISELAVPTLEIKVIEANDTKYFDMELLDMLLWQLEPIAPGEDFYAEGISIEEGKTALEIVRTFFELYYFGCDHEDFLAFFGDMFYDRLELIHYLSSPSPTVGTLCGKERGRIIAGIKEYHFLRNALQDVGLQASHESVEKQEDGSQRQSQDSVLITLHMRMDRHNVELAFLLDQTMRKLVGAIGKAENEDSTIANYDSILVINSVKLTDLKGIYEWLESYALDRAAVENIKVMNNLETALKYCSAGSTIFVVSGDYAVSGLGKLGEGGSLVGIKISNIDVTLTPTDEIGDVWMLSSPASNTPVHLENLNLVVDGEADRSLSSCIYVSSGSFKMSHCVIRKVKCLDGCDGSDESLNKGGIQPLVRSESAEVGLQNCEFVNFGCQLDEKGYPISQERE